jgi:D-alanyl-D-alanine dipeptidase
MRAALLLAVVLLPAALTGQPADDELVNVKDLIPDIVLDLRYNTTANFFNQKLYSTDEAYLTLATVRRLRLVQDSLRARGLGLKIFDGYRPRAVQYVMFAIFPNPTYVADPSSGSNHNRGGAVDLSIVDLSTGQEVPMPTDFDHFGPEASHTWSIGLSAEQVANRELLRTIMEQVGGFTSYEPEWWHYHYTPGLGPLLDFQLK